MKREILKKIKEAYKNIDSTENTEKKEIYGHLIVVHPEKPHNPEEGYYVELTNINEKEVIRLASFIRDEDGVELYIGVRNYTYNENYKVCLVQKGNIPKKYIKKINLLKRKRNEMESHGYGFLKIDKTIGLDTHVVVYQDESGKKNFKNVRYAIVV